MVFGVFPHKQAYDARQPRMHYKHTAGKAHLILFSRVSLLHGNQNAAHVKCLWQEGSDKDPSVPGMLPVACRRSSSAECASCGAAACTECTQRITSLAALPPATASIERTIQAHTCRSLNLFRSCSKLTSWVGDLGGSLLVVSLI